MKRYDTNNHEKYRAKQWNKEQNAGGFRCQHCKEWVVINDFMGTIHRNHCNVCLWSKHVDEKKGDRRSTCFAGMKPIGFTFKHEGYGRQGETMLIHLCLLCQKISINRIAADDAIDEIFKIFEESKSIENELNKKLLAENICVLGEKDMQELHIQLFGK